MNTKFLYCKAVQKSILIASSPGKHDLFFPEAQKKYANTDILERQVNHSKFCHRDHVDCAA